MATPLSPPGTGLDGWHRADHDPPSLGVFTNYMVQIGQ